MKADEARKSRGVVTDTMCYVAAHPGVDGYFFASVIEPGRSFEDGKKVAKLIRQGAIISRVTLAEATAGLKLYKARPPTSHPPAAQS